MFAEIGNKRSAAHWPLRANPFASGFDSPFFYRSRSHEEALARLHLLVADGDAAFGMIAGEVGTGKTFVALEFARSLGADGAFAPLVVTGAEDAAQALCQATAALRRSAATARTTLHAARTAFKSELLNRCRPLGLHAVLVIDEAQMLSDDDLLGLRGTLNQVDGIDGLLTIVLVGTPDLRERALGLPPVGSRIRLRWDVSELDPQEIAPYLEHRLLAAGHPTGKAFSPEAAAALSEGVARTPRELNHVARLALFAAQAAGSNLVGAEHVRSALADCGCPRMQVA